MVAIRFLGVILILILFQSCSKNDPKPIDNDEDVVGYIPRENKVYNYKLSNAAGQFATVATKVTKSKDTLDTRIVDILSTTTSVNGLVFSDSIRAYSSRGFTYNIMVGHRLYKDYVKYKPYPRILEINLQGHPQVMVLDNQNIVNASAMQFPGGRVQLYKQEAGTETYFETWDITKYFTGGIAALEEIETPAGKFKCSRWVYESEDSNITYNPKDDTFVETSTTNKTTLWLSHGVGIVKLMADVHYQGGLVNDYTSTLTSIE